MSIKKGITIKLSDKRTGKIPPKELSKKINSLFAVHTVPILTDKTNTSYRTLVKIANGKERVMQSVIDKVSKNIKTQKL